MDIFSKTCLYSGIVLALMLAFVGCNDCRISQVEFKEIQESMHPAPATQPVFGPVSNVVVDQSLGQYKVGPGDVLGITLTGSDQAGLAPIQQVRVSRTGEIEMPIAGKIRIGGMDLEGAESAIQKAYVPKVYRQAIIHIDVAKPENTCVLVTGAVTTPGLVPLLRTQRNLLYAIVGAGGVTELASRKVTLRRIRSPKEVITLDLSSPDGLRQALAMAPLQNGDVVDVLAATPNMIFVGGLVRDPRPQTYPAGVRMTVLQALAASGGLRTDLTPREATLIRHMPDGQDVQVKLNLDRITCGKDPNMTLAAGDILWIPYSVETRVQEWINQNIYIRGGASFSYSQSGDHNYLHGASFNNSTNGNTGNLQNQFDPFGFLNQNSALNNLVSRPQAAQAAP